MDIPIGTIVKRKLLDLPIGCHYGVVVAHHFGIPIVMEKMKNGAVRSVYLQDFAAGHEVVAEVGRVDHPIVIQARTFQLSRATNPWSLWANCEHFAREIAAGKNESYQFQLGIIAIVAVGILAS